MNSALIMELGVEVGKLKGSNEVLKAENKRLKEINDQLIGSLEKLAMGKPHNTFTLSGESGPG